MAEPRIVFFGCIRRPGHFLFTSEGIGAFVHHDDPMRMWERFDGLLAPRGAEREGVTAIHHMFDGAYTVLAMWDRGIDSRPKSNAMFIAEGTLIEPEVWLRARDAFPVTHQRLFAAHVPVRTPQGGKGE